MSVTLNGRPIWTEIDLDAVAHNVGTLKRIAGGAELAAVVKANAYGHGLIPIAAAALSAGADRLAVICTEEGAEVRRAGIGAPVLVLGYIPPEEAPWVVDLKLTPIVTSLELALSLSNAAQTARVVQPVHLKVDTGLNRYGLRPAEAIALAAGIRELPGLYLEGLCTHFLDAGSSDKAETKRQFELFIDVANRLSGIPIRHVSNTAALMDTPELNLDMVRPGIGIYGCYPDGVERPQLPLKPVLSWKTRIIRINHLVSGESVSYGATWRATRLSNIAVVVCGYADGLPRVLSNRGQMLVRGQKAPIVGRVCMDMTLIDVTEIPGAQEGDEVAIIGKQGNEEIKAEDIASLCDTVSYEILSRIAARVPRIPTRSGLSQPLAETSARAGAASQAS